MASGEFIEILSPSALRDLDALNEKLVQTVTMAQQVNAAFGTIQTPSGNDDAIKELNTQLQKQEEIIKKLQTQLTNLSNTRTKSVAKTREEIVENRIANQQADMLFKANSKLAGAYANLNAKRTMAAKTLRDLIASEKASSAEIARAQKEFDKLDEKVRKADRAVGDFSKNVGNYKSAFSGLSNLMGAFGIATGIGLFADITKNIFNTTMELQSLDLALETVSGSAEVFADNQAFLKNLANQYGIEIKGLTKNFTEFWVASQGKLEAQEIKDIFTSISKAAGVMGLSVQKQDQAFLALQQMMSKGTVQAEELKRQLGDALPGAIKAATMAYQKLHPEMKVTEAFLLKQMEAGAVLSKELLPELAKSFEELYGIETINNVHTLQSEVSRLSNAWTDFVRSITETDESAIAKVFNFFIVGAQGLLEMFTRLTDSWDTINKKAEARGAGEGKTWFTELMGGKEGEDAVRQAQDNIKLAQTGITKINAEITKTKKILDNRNFADYLFGINENQQEKLEELHGKLGVYNELLKESQAVVDKAGKPKEKPTVIAKTKEQLAAEERARKEKLKAEEEYQKSLYELELAKLERAKEIAKDEYNLHTENLALKLLRSEEYAKKEKAVEELKYKEKLRVAKKEAKDKGIAENIMTTPIKLEWATKQEDLIETAGKRVGEAYSDYFDRLSKEVKEEYDKFHKDMEKYDVDPDVDKKREENERKLKEAKDEFKKYMEGFSTDFLSNAGFDSLTMFFDGTFAKLQAGAKATGKEFEFMFNTVAEIAQETFNFIAKAFDKQNEERLAALEKDRDIAIKFAGDNAAAKEKIDKEYEAKKRAIEAKDFVRKQRITMVNIIMDTAQAIVGTLANTPPPAGWVLAALVGAIGAAQLAVVASQKPPAYFTGTDNAKEGWATTDERGAELHTDKDGRVKDFGSSKGSRLKYLSKGDKIYTASETRRILENDFNANLSHVLSSRGIDSPIIINNGLSAAEMDEIMERHIASQPKIINRWDKDGFASSISRNDNVTKRSENRGSGIGITI